jgi:hypothetical protein
MWAIPNATVSVLHSSNIDDWDGTSNETISASGVDASIIEQSRLVYDPQSTTHRIIRNVAGRLPSGTSIAARDRIRDEVTGTVYMVVSVRQHQNHYYTSDVTLELRRVDDDDP